MRASAVAVAASVTLGVLLLTASADAQRPWASKVPQEFRTKKNPLPSTPDVIAKGKEHYTNTCVPCHGEQGFGDGVAAEFMEPKPKPLIVDGKLNVPDGVAFWVITNGIDGTGMASLGDSLNEQERWEVIRYLHTLGAPAPAPAPPAAVVTPAPAPTAGKNVRSQAAEPQSAR